MIDEKDGISCSIALLCIVTVTSILVNYKLFQVALTIVHYTFGTDAGSDARS